MARSIKSLRFDVRMDILFLFLSLVVLGIECARESNWAYLWAVLVSLNTYSLTTDVHKLYDTQEGQQKVKS